MNKKRVYKKLTEDQVAQMVMMRNQGASWKAIGASFGISEKAARAYQYRRQLDICLPVRGRPLHFKGLLRVVKRERTCLRCRAPFPSAGAHNRICIVCRVANADLYQGECAIRITGRERLSEHDG